MVVRLSEQTRLFSDSPEVTQEVIHAEASPGAVVSSANINAELPSTASVGQMRHSTPSFARTLRKRVPEASYLVAENADRYRPIMRLFYEQHMSHRYTLEASHVLEHIRLNGMQEYTEAQCEQDLRQLCEWGNLAAEQDRARAKTVEEFIRRKLIYNITPYGIAFERLLVELEDERGTRGSLDVGLFEALLTSIEALSPLLEELLAASSEALIKKTQRVWYQTYDAFDRIGKQASDYLGALDRARHDDAGDLEAFLAYKDVLIQYLMAFVTNLYDNGDRVRALLTPWPEQGKVDALISALVEYDLRYNPTPDGSLPVPKELKAHHERTWWSLYRWFQVGGGLDTLRRRTNIAIEQVARQSQRLMDRRSGISRKRDLEKLAVYFAACRTNADSHKLAGLAYGCATPRHVLGSAEVFLAPDSGSAWQMTPHQVLLQPIRHGGRKVNRATPVNLHDIRQEQVLREELDRRRAEAGVWDELFAAGRLELGRAHITDPAVRAQVLAVLASCLASPSHEAQAPDGSRIRLEWPNTSEPGRLTSGDGDLYLPRFVLVRTVFMHLTSSGSPQEVGAPALAKAAGGGQP